MASEKTRKIMLARVFNSIVEAMKQGKIVNVDKLVAYMGTEEGVARRTALEYLKTLELAEKIIVKDGKIWTKEAFEKLESEFRSDEEHAAKEEKGVNE